MAPYLNVPAALLGRYTVVFAAKSPAEQDQDATTFPQGDGGALLSVSKSGNVRLRGRLADGTLVTGANSLTKNNEWPFYASLAAGKGSISGKVIFRDVANVSDLDLPDALWFQPSVPTAKNYPEAWPAGIKTTVLGSKFVKLKASAKTSIFTGLPESAADSNATITFSAGNLPEPGMTATLRIHGNNVVKVMDETIAGLNVALRFPFPYNPEANDGPKFHINGIVKGSFLHPVTQSRSYLRAVVFQKQHAAFGYFTGPTESGSVVMEPKGR